jgi:polyribonucleotide nucleotidyltransferase
VKIEIENDGRVHIASSDLAAIEKAKQMIQDVTAEAAVGNVYKGKVVKIADFGAFVEILPGTQGLLHISEIAHERVRSVTDFLKEGDVVEVKVLDIDRTGRIKLSRKVLLPN